MFVIRQEQMDALTGAVATGFEDRVVRRLYHFFPDHCRQAGDARVREFVRYGAHRADTYGLTSERDMVEYIDLMVVLGLDFDSGDRYLWAFDILNHPDLTPEGKLLALRKKVEAISDAESLPRLPPRGSIRPPQPQAPRGDDHA